MSANFCRVENDLDRLYRQADMAEEKYKRIQAFLKGSGRVEQAVIDSIREDTSGFEKFIEDRVDRQLVIVSAINLAHPPIDYDCDYLRGIVRGLVSDFVADQYETFEAILIDLEWPYWETV